MATKTEIYEFRKKEENDFYNVEDFNNNMDMMETALTEFDDSGTAEGVTSFPDMLAKLVTGNKLAVTLKNLKAGLQFVLHAGSIVNNCVTDNPNLPLSAAQGKALQDLITVLNNEAKSLSSNLTTKATYVGYYLNNQWINISLKSNQTVLLTVNAFSQGNSASNALYLICGASGADKSGTILKLGGIFDLITNWNSGLSIGVYASANQWIQISALYL